MDIIKKVKEGIIFYWTASIALVCYVVRFGLEDFTSRATGAYSGCTTGLA